MGELETAKVRVPFLKAYLRAERKHAPHQPSWIDLAGWVVFLVLAAVLDKTSEHGELWIVLAAVLGYGTTRFLREKYRARNDLERLDEKGYEAIRKFKKVVEDSRIEKRVPPDILRSLETAVEAYNLAIAQVHREDPMGAAEREGPIRRTLQACFLAAAPLIREEKHSRGEWEAILEKRSLINEVVETIHTQTMRLKVPLGFSSERLNALRELEYESDSQSVRLLD